MAIAVKNGMVRANIGAMLFFGMDRLWFMGDKVSVRVSAPVFLSLLESSSVVWVTEIVATESVVELVAVDVSGIRERRAIKAMFSIGFINNIGCKF